jgi:hypothetical protein
MVAGRRERDSKSNWLRPAIIFSGAFGLRQLGLSPLSTLGIAALFGLLFTPRTKP